METTLNEFKETARNAFRWSSFDPDEKAFRVIKEHEDVLTADAASIEGNEDRERYIAKYKNMFGAWLSAESRCASAAVTGPAKFDNDKADRSMRIAIERLNGLILFRERTFAAIEKRALDARPEETKQEEEWELLKKELTESFEGLLKQRNPLLISNLAKRIETLANNGKVDLVSKAIAFLRLFNAEKGAIVTERHSLFKLPETAQRVYDSRNCKIEMIGGRVVIEDDRVKLFFKEKPSAQVVDELKKNAFKWAPSTKAWQRQSTQNGVAAAKRLANFINNLPNEF